MINNGKSLAYKLILTIVLVVSSIHLSYSQEPLPFRNQISIVFHSKVLNEDRQFWIYLPEGYDKGNKLYPVIYLLDPDQNFAYVTEMERFLSDRYRMPKSIVVGIVNTDRVRDFTPVHSMTFHGKFDNSLRNTGGAKKFLSFLQQEAVPFIESNFRTAPYRTLEGHSLGGLFSLYCKNEAPEMFQSYIIISPAIYDGNMAILQQFSEALQKNISRIGYLHLSIGDEPDGFGPVRTLNENLKKYADNKLIWNFKQYSNEDHFSVGYQSMYDGLKFIYSKWFLDPRDTSKVKSYMDIKTHFETLSGLYGYQVIPDEDFVNESGYQRLNNNDFVHAIEIFTENVKNNPQSANAYDSLGEAYMKSGNKNSAIKNYEKSIKLDPHNQNAVHMLQELKK